MDNDNEVRDRAILYLEVLKKKQKSLSTQYILSGDDSYHGDIMMFVCLQVLVCPLLV